MNINTVSKQWASRPNDERYTSLEELKATVAKMRYYFLTNQFYAEENDELAALRAERDELREALETSTSLLDHTDKYGTFPPPQNPYTPNAIKRAVIANRAVLAKYEEAQ